MPKKQKTTKDGLGPGTFIRLDLETRAWLAGEAKKIDRSVSWLARKILTDAKQAKSGVAA